MKELMNNLIQQGIDDMRLRREDDKWLYGLLFPGYKTAGTFDDEITEGIVVESVKAMADNTVGDGPLLGVHPHISSAASFKLTMHTMEYTQVFLEHASQLVKDRITKLTVNPQAIISGEPDELVSSIQPIGDLADWHLFGMSWKGNDHSNLTLCVTPLNTVCQRALLGQKTTGLNVQMS